MLVSIRCGRALLSLLNHFCNYSKKSLPQTRFLAINKKKNPTLNEILDKNKIQRLTRWKPETFTFHKQLFYSHIFVLNTQLKTAKHFMCF